MQQFTDYDKKINLKIDEQNKTLVILYTKCEYKFFPSHQSSFKSSVKNKIIFLSFFKMVNKEGNSTALLDIQGYCSDNDDDEIEEVVIDDQNKVRIKVNYLQQKGLE